jgi:hypothetical protein
MTKRAPPLVKYGGYGGVTLEDDRATKRVRLFYDQDLLDGTNVNDAIFAANIMNTPLRNFVRVHGVQGSEDGRALIHMERGKASLKDYINEVRASLS